MDLNDPRLRLKVLNQSNPSLRSSAAPQPQLQVQQAAPQVLRFNTGDQNVNSATPDQAFTVSRSGGSTAPVDTTPTHDTTGAAAGLNFLKATGNVVAAPAEPFAAGIARILPGGQNDLKENANQVDVLNRNQQAYTEMYRTGKINKDQYTRALQGLSDDFASAGNESQRIADTADRSKVLGSAAMVASAPFLGAAEAGNSLLAKSGLGALEGLGLGATNQFATQADPTLKGTAVDAITGALAGAGIPLVGAGLGKIIKSIFPSGASVGLTKAEVNELKKTNSVQEVFSKLMDKYGQASPELYQAAENIAGSKNTKFIIRELENLPQQAAGAGGLSALVSDTVAREKYGVSGLTGEATPVAPATPTAPVTPDVRPLGPQEPNTGNGIRLNANKVTDEAYRTAEEEALKQAGIAPVGTSDADFRINLKRPATEALKSDASLATKGASTSTSQDAVEVLVHGLANTDAKGSVRGAVEKLFPEIEGNDKNRLIKELTKAKTTDDVTTLLQDARETAAVKAAAPAPTEAAQTEAEVAAAGPSQSGTDTNTINPETGSVETPGRQFNASSDGVAEQVNTAADKAAADSAPTSKDLFPDASPEEHAAIQQVMDKLGDADKSVQDLSKVRTQEKGQRIAAGQAAYDAAGGGEEGVRAKLAALKGEYSKSGYSPIEAAPENQKAILDMVEATDMLPFQKLNTQNALRKIWGSNPEKPTKSDVQYIREFLGDDTANFIEAAIQDDPKSWRDKVAQAPGIFKALQSTGDLSGGFRQAGVLGSAHPYEWAKAQVESLKYAKSGEYYKQEMNKIQEDPFYKTAREYGLDMPGVLGEKEEAYQASNLLEGKVMKDKLKVGNVVAGSDRAYGGLLTKLRFNVYKNLVSKMGGEDAIMALPNGKKIMTDLAEAVNTGSGRGGKPGGWLDDHAKTLGETLFSPRLWASRLNMLNPRYYQRLSGPARAEALRQAAAFSSIAATVLASANAAGFDVETDPRSSDFLKIKKGNTRYDILGGFQQNIVFAWRELSGETKNSTTGEVKSLEAAGFGDKDRVSIAGDMGQNKLNPLFGAGLRIIRGKDRGGNKVNPLTEIGKLFVPLNAQGAYETSVDQGSVVKGTLMNLPGTFGVGVQTYGNTKTKDQGKDSAGNTTFTGKVTDNMVKDSNGQVILDDKGKPVTVEFPDGATAIEKKALLDEKRSSALSSQYKKGLSGEDQALMKLSDEKLKGYVKDGTIDQAHFDKIKNYQKTAESTSKQNNYSVPDGITTDQAKTFYQKYNSMDKKDQEAWLKQPADDNARAIATELNKVKSEGLDDFNPSNALSKAYAEYEKDINTHPEYTSIDKQNKAKSFQVFATKLNYSDPQAALYNEGSSKDLYALIEQRQISKEDLNKAIDLDNKLYTSGLSGSLKFSKKFRESYGIAVPLAPGEVASGSGSKSTYHGGTLSIGSLASNSGTSGIPKFSSRSRGVTFKAPIIPKSTSTKKISINL